MSFQHKSGLGKKLVSLRSVWTMKQGFLSGEVWGKERERRKQTEKENEGYRSVTECFPVMYKALSLIFSTNYIFKKSVVLMILNTPEMKTLLDMEFLLPRFTCFF